METLENSERHWPARRKHMFFQIFMAQHICRDAVEIHWANGNIQVIRPVRGISINGEAQGGWICPYISRHLLSLNPLLACCRRYSRGER